MHANTNKKKGENMLEDFIREVKEEVQKRFPEEKVETHEVLKNNSTIYHGICIQKKGAKICPNIYLDGYYKAYINKEHSIEEIVDAVVSMYESHKSYDYMEHIDNLDYSGVKDKIVFRLIGTKWNERLLQESPNIPYLDMSIVFYILVHNQAQGIGSIRVTHEIIEMWGEEVSVEELLKIALVNTQRLLPAVVRPMMNVVEEIVSRNKSHFEEEVMEFDEEGFHILSNVQGINGASAILYPGLLEKIADYYEKDLYLLPSSIHEMIVLPYESYYDIEELSEMVKQVNETEVDIEDILGERVYYYDREKRELR